ncbi:MAG: aminomethyl-transferring glycine dehydrogenase subunit GcvPA [Gammaproteobacteria bacterium]
MPFIPHTETDIQQMLDTIGVDSINDLFDEIPEELMIDKLDGVPSTSSELEVSKCLTERASRDNALACFVGAGAYEHHIPSAVWEITTRGEFYSAYTPYQAEASQGTLQLLYEYQTMMANLTTMDVSNASLYDGASGLAEAVLMAVRANRKARSKRILIPRTVHPRYRAVVQNIIKNQDIEIETLDYAMQSGHITPESLSAVEGEFAALVIPQPNFFGVLEEVDALTDWAHQQGALVIAVVNPVALAMLKPPGEWGAQGADIACGEGQPLGIPLASGGPYFGFMCCKQGHVRQMPGRIIGRTVDQDGKTGFALTLQAREQHIRRSKATSNICTNQGLMVTAATIYMALLGANGLQQVANQAHANTRLLVNQLSALDGVNVVFSRPVFHEAVISLGDVDVDSVLKIMSDQGLLGGYSLKRDYPELGNAMSFCVTETKSRQDIERYARVLESALVAA